MDKWSAQSESLEETNNESTPLGNSSALAKVEELPWRWLSSLLVVRGLLDLGRILVPIGNGSYKSKKGVKYSKHPSPLQI